MLFWTLNLAMVTLLCNRHHYVASIFSPHYFSIPVLRFAILLHSLVHSCCSPVFGTHVHGILGKRLHSWYRGRLGNRSLGEKHHLENGITKKYFLLEEDLKNEAEGKK